MGKLLRYLSVLSLLVATLVSSSCSEEFLTKEPPGVAAAPEYPAGSAFFQKGTASCGGWGFFQPSQCLFEAVEEQKGILEQDSDYTNMLY